MIATLTGMVAEKLGELVVLDVRGVGYGVLVPVEDLSQLTTGDSAKLYIHEHIRENAHDIYGFSKLDSMKLFDLLLDVTGVGPKMSLSKCRYGNAEDFADAIANGDTKYIQAASGVGKRVAERVIVELKDKVGLVASDTATNFLQAPSLLHDEAAQALVSLGYTPQDAMLALAGLDTKLSTEERIKLALKGSSI